MLYFLVILMLALLGNLYFSILQYSLVSYSISSVISISLLYCTDTYREGLILV
jgi:hypothetical protein